MNSAQVKTSVCNLNFPQPDLKERLVIFSLESYHDTVGSPEHPLCYLLWVYLKIQGELRMGPE